MSKKYYQFIRGEQQGQVKEFKDTLSIGDDTFVVFTDGSRVNLNAVGELDDFTAYNNTNLVVAEISSPKNTWTFKKNPNKGTDLLKTDRAGQKVIAQDGKEYEIPDTYGAKHAKEHNVIIATPPKLSSKEEERRNSLLESTKKDSAPKSPSVETKENTDAQLHEPNLVSELQQVDESKKSALPKLPKLSEDQMFVKLISDKLKRVDTTISMELDLSLPTVDAVEVLRESAFTSDEQFDMLINQLVNDISTDDVRDLLKHVIRSYYEKTKLHGED